MLIPVSWLNKYVPVKLDPNDLAHRLTISGTEIGEVNEVGSDWDRDHVLVGEVLSVDPHPNADRLFLPTVDVGQGKMFKVVCGAQNIAAGQKVAFAKEGAMLLNYRSGKLEPVKSVKIRGVQSAGMVCSEFELRIGTNHDGIMVLDEQATVGAPLVDYIGDVILDAEITPNRPDCLSILGIAREVAALTGEVCNEPVWDYPEKQSGIHEHVKVEILDSSLCSRYAASLITGVTVAESPIWLQDVLRKCGLRPINNVVDATNYVMLEYGQPLHPFDFDMINDGTITVRSARQAESLEMLDGETRKLESSMLVIADSERAVALAGVMGGVDTSVKDRTTSVLLESANFDPINIRRTVSSMRLSTDASYRFERGIRSDLVPKALRRVTDLVIQLAGGIASKGIIDVQSVGCQKPPVSITSDCVERVLGMRLDMDRAKRTLESLGFIWVDGDGSNRKRWSMSFHPPYWRADINIEVDIVEELARIIGYDEIPTTMLSVPVPHHNPNPQKLARESLRDALASSGMYEVATYSLTDRETLLSVRSRPGAPDPISVTNPISSELSYMRTTLRGSVLKALASNRRMSQEGLRLFEIGRVYLAVQTEGQGGLPEEKEMLVGVLSGPRSQENWVGSQGDMDFFDAKGTVDFILDSVGVVADYERTCDDMMVLGRAAILTVSGHTLGTLGEVSQDVLSQFGIEHFAVALFEIDVDGLSTIVGGRATTYEEVSRFPESNRDLSLIVDDDVPSSKVQRIINRNELVMRSSPIDVYSGCGVSPGKKSITYRVAFQSARHTLTADLVDSAQREILIHLQSELGAELRD